MNTERFLQFKHTSDIQTIPAADGGKRMMVRVQPTQIQTILSHYHRHPKDKSPGVVATITMLKNFWDMSDEQVNELASQMPPNWWIPIKSPRRKKEENAEHKPRRKSQRRKND